ncbi:MULTISPECIES: ABC transporter ATP-binding protein [unclassified Plantactinospora]|uniref:ABC transporter ATP-binding protein n=1 Tax=unclassified Plantactinospora TaxID=2631981 RepID=UPI000D159B49|nr:MULTISPECIES: ABC transporter ATP-binding protein [unclassified Plantactinospora]AVT28424.1 ABC transporter ATP-binding protein [Plantactinospora sp. BC1]AVT38339.1 ABC transporter ATP-binding protein [Plantactinospora sp. BB1]
MLEVNGLMAWYGEAQALHGVSVRVGEGEVVTLVGRNGAGKTTLVRCLIGLHRQVGGSVSFLGRDVTRTPAHQRARAGMGWVQDDRGIYASLSVEENLLLPPRVSDRAWTLERVYETFPELADRRRAPGTTLSGGEQQMLAIARALRTGARLMLMDEPSEGLAPVVVARIGTIIRQIKATGAGVLLIEQNVKFAATVADRHYLLSQGRVVETLDNSEFRRREGELLTHLGI